MFEIKRGTLETGGIKMVLYGVEGIGKTTFASQLPDPLFIDTEDGTAQLDVKRYPVPTTWEMLLAEIREAAATRACKTLVIDTIDWAQRLAVAHVLAKNGWPSIETPGYGRGYVELYDCFGHMLNALSESARGGMHVCLIAHAQITQFKPPEESAAYDRYQLMLSSGKNANIPAMCKQWADMLLFANYKSYVVIDKKTSKATARGSNRVLYANHGATWDAKNRYGLPDEMPMEYKSIAQVFERQGAQKQPMQAPGGAFPQAMAGSAQHNATRQQPQPQGQGQPKGQAKGHPAVSPQQAPQMQAQVQARIAETVPAAMPMPTPQEISKADEAAPRPGDKGHETLDLGNPFEFTPDDRMIMASLPKKLTDIMEADMVTPKVIEAYARQKGHQPEGVPITSYPSWYFDVLLANWEQAKKTFEKIQLPF